MRTALLWIKKVATKDGVRRIPVSTVSMTGAVLGSEFESALERDLILTAAFEDDVNWFQSQPVKIHYTDKNGVARHYTPDLFIHFGTEENPTRRPQLCEVKYRKDLIAKWKELLPKFRAARAYCRARGWDFKIYDETRIRTPRLANIQFLWRYKSSTRGEGFYGPIMDELLDLTEPTTMNALLERMYPNIRERGEAIWVWWTMVVQGAIKCDLDQPLKKSTLFWVDDSRKQDLRLNFRMKEC
jgi:hypothetical protein